MSGTDTSGARWSGPAGHRGSAADATVLALVPAPRRSRLALALVWLAPIALAIYALRETLTPSDDGFPMTRALASIVVVVTISLVAAFVTFRAMRRHRLILDGDRLIVETGFHREHAALSDLDLAHARILDLGERRDLRPARKIRGQQLPIPGFQSGWYWLRNRQKAFVARSGGSRVLWIPAAGGTGLLLQPRQPRALLERLRAQAAATGSVHEGQRRSPSRSGEAAGHWFPAKEYGWGWGLPITWQGWAVLGGYVGAVAVLAWFTSAEREFLVGMVLLTLLLILVCMRKGEPPRWRWGHDD